VFTGGLEDLERNSLFAEEVHEFRRGKALCADNRYKSLPKDWMILDAQDADPS